MLRAARVRPFFQSQVTADAIFELIPSSEEAI
jgi:hypothetical protein